MSATDDTNLCSSREFELIQSILVLAFTPTIHRTYREVRAWFRELEPEDIAQQVLTFFLELAASAPVETLNGVLPIMLSRSLRKNEGFLVKEIPSGNPVLSARAVESRIQRILKRLQKVASLDIAPRRESSEIGQHKESKDTKNLSQSARIFSLRTFSDFLPISKSRRPLSLDSSPSQRKMKTQQFSTVHQNVLTFPTLPKAIRRSRVISGAARQPLAANQASVSPCHTSRPTQSGESLPSNPDAGPTRIIRKELAGNEETSSKQICLPLAPARTRHVLLVADFRIGGICSGGRRLAMGERSQRLDAGVHDDHRSRSFARFYCGRRFDVRFW
jgi:hypothetical protein